MEKKTQANLRLRLFPRAEQAVRAGHPWVFEGSIKSQSREAETGELAVIYDRQDRFFGMGLYEAESPIRLRMLHCGKPCQIDREFWLERARACLAKRKVAVISSKTNGARMINGESEGFPGIVMDQYGKTVVVKVYAGSWFAHWDEIESVLREVFTPDFFVLRMSRNIVEVGKRHGLVEGFRGEVGDETVIFKENGLLFEAAVLRGQKTGFFLDQRDNRQRVGELAANRDVLNVFSFSGGFSLYAARGGARSVTDLDISHHALESGARNFSLNSELCAVARQAVQADAFKWMDEDRTPYDLIITDPPTLAKRNSEKEGALRAYQRLNSAAIAKLRPGGVLVAASCSAHVTASEFFQTVIEAVKNSGKKYDELWRAGHAVDHPASFMEAEYLKAICLQFS